MLRLLTRFVFRFSTLCLLSVQYVIIVLTGSNVSHTFDLFPAWQCRCHVMTGRGEEGGQRRGEWGVCEGGGRGWGGEGKRDRGAKWRGGGGGGTGGKTGKLRSSEAQNTHNTTPA